MRTLQDIKLSENDRQAIGEAVKLLLERFPVDRVILFGSKARGTDDAESDIDLLLLTRCRMGWRERTAITDALFDIQLAHDVVISILVVPAAEWDGGVYRVLPIHEEVSREGVAA